MVSNFVCLSSITVTLLVSPAFAGSVTTSCGVGAGAGPFILKCPTFTVTGILVSNSVAAGASLMVKSLDIIATKADASGHLDFTDQFTLPAPPVLGSKSITGTFVDPTGAGMETLTLSGFFDVMAFGQATAIGTTLLATESKGLAINENNGGGPFNPAVPYWLTGEIQFSLPKVGDEIDPTYITISDSPAPTVPEPTGWGLMSLGLIVISARSMFHASCHRTQ
jgi:hypothetical protein